MLCSSEKHYSKDINSYYIYWETLHLPNFSNNKLTYIVILLLPFAKCFISVNKYLIRKCKTWQYTAVCRNQIRKIALPYLKIVSELRKNFSSFFHRIKFIAFETVWSKKNYSAIASHLFLLQIYTAWYKIIYCYIVKNQ